MTAVRDYAGVIHFHSDFSFDGRRPVSEIVRTARQCRLDFLMITDHGTLRAREAGLEGWHDGVLLIVGEEISPRFNHYLAFGIDRAVAIPEDSDTPPQAYMDAVARQGGFGFIAHPDHGGNALFHVKHYPWNDWSVGSYAGMGIWDFMTDWQSALTGPCKALWCYLQPSLVLKGPKPETLRRWDALTRERKIVGIGELDNHDTVHRFLGIPIPVFPFRRAFRTIRTHLLVESPMTGHAATDIVLLYDALKRGRVYVALESHQETKGFFFIVRGASGTALPGDDHILDEASQIEVRLPTWGRIRIIKDGQLWNETKGISTGHPLKDAGCYRVEVSRRLLGRYRPWIYSNPIYVRQAGSRRA